MAYAEWLPQQTGKAYRLPSEAEWEYAARAETETVYWWGNDIERNRAHCLGCGSQWDGKRTATVGSFDPNPFGLVDSVGNVWEWAQDCWHESYAGAPADAHAWLSGGCSQRLIRGGSWFNFPGGVRSAERFGDHPDNRSQVIGFRLARDFK